MTYKKRKYHKRRGGMSENMYDIEEGMPESFNSIDSTPPDPERFNAFNKKIIKESFKPSTIEESTLAFDSPTPEEKQKLENKQMFDEDPLFSNPLDEPMPDWGKTGGRKKNRKSRKSRKKSRKSRKKSRKTRRR
jgi:hypothetical protein